MERVQAENFHRHEGMAFGQYLAIRAILFAVVSMVAFALTAFAAGLVFWLSETNGWPEDPSAAVAVIWIAGGVGGVVLLVRSVGAFVEHSAVNRKLLALRPYTSWADGVSAGGSIGDTTARSRQGTSDISRDWKERAEMAGNPMTPVDLLDRLAGDSMSAVRLAVASNPKSPEWIVERLQSDVDPDVRREAVRRR